MIFDKLFTQESDESVLLPEGPDNLWQRELSY
jgi:hypothetical protein